MSLPGYDAWKLASPYDREWECPCCGEVTDKRDRGEHECPEDEGEEEV